MSAMRSDGGRQVRKRVELLELTGPHDGQQTFDGAFTLLTPRREHDFAPLNRRPKGSLGRLVRGRDTGLVHERKEMRMVHEDACARLRTSALAALRCRSPRAKNFRDQFRAGQRGTPRTRISAEAMPQPEEAAIEREGLPAERFAAGVVARSSALNRLRVTCAQQNCRWPTTYFR